MSSLMVFGILALVLFLIPFVTKRRFGILGLALAAGSLLATLWSQEVTQLVGDTGLTFTVFPLQSLVTLVLTVAPALIVLPKSAVTHSKLLHVVGAALFALLALSLLLVPLEMSVAIEGTGRAVYDFLAQHHLTIVTAGLVAALVDLFFTKTSKAPKLHDKH